jgi:hypothetical protein
MKKKISKKESPATVQPVSKKGLSLAPPPYGLSFTDSKPVQKKENKTGMPDGLKSGVESLSGVDLSDVKVNYNSSQPAQLNAHAYAQGSQIHIAPGQEKHLPHEAWHVVQQKQGRVKPTGEIKGNIKINDNPALENEADRMGAVASKNIAQQKTDPQKSSSSSHKGTHQMVRNVRREQGRAQEVRTFTLQFGSRPGWPDNPLLSRLVTHAVYRVNGGTVYGYGKQGHNGQIVVDNPGAAAYTWIPNILTLPMTHYLLFQQTLRQRANGFRYTGVGGNCYTPIVRTLEQIKPREDAAAVAQIDAILPQLTAANHGMGTTITNALIGTAAAVAGIGLAAWALMRKEKEGSNDQFGKSDIA